jgi:hypothetical protein
MVYVSLETVWQKIGSLAWLDETWRERSIFNRWSWKNDESDVCSSWSNICYITSRFDKELITIWLLTKFITFTVLYQYMYVTWENFLTRLVLSISMNFYGFK